MTSLKNLMKINLDFGSDFASIRAEIREKDGLRAVSDHSKKQEKAN